jgi:class 3 adenylate cyclase
VTRAKKRLRLFQNQIRRSECPPSRLPLECAREPIIHSGPCGWGAPLWPRNASNAGWPPFLAADVAGYSRLIGADEEGTLARLKAHRREVIDPKIGEHRGRIVKTTGDGLLVEFGSVINALRCATEIQTGIAERKTVSPSDRQIEFRIGIHQGDVVVEDGDIFGDGVDRHLRLQSVAAGAELNWIVCVLGSLSRLANPVASTTASAPAPP